MCYIVALRWNSVLGVLYVPADTSGLPTCWLELSVLVLASGQELEVLGDKRLARFRIASNLVPKAKKIQAAVWERVLGCNKESRIKDCGTSSSRPLLPRATQLGLHAGFFCV